MGKEKAYNPVQAQRKAEKNKDIRKSTLKYKAKLKSRQYEKLARRNPGRIQKQIDDLKGIVSNGGKLSKPEEEVLAGLEKELRDVLHAREQLGDRLQDVHSSSRPGSGNSLGKRPHRNYREDVSSDDETIPEDVQRIPMPRDTPPPIPKEIMNAWYAKRRAKRAAELGTQQQLPPDRIAPNSNNSTPPTRPNDGTKFAARVLPITQEYVSEPKTVYESKPVVRNLAQEAVSAFMPTAVRRKLDKVAGTSGALLEPEEADQMEKAGYAVGQHAPTTVRTGPSNSEITTSARPVTVEDVDSD